MPIFGFLGTVFVYITLGSNFSFSDSDDTITIKNVGYYRIKTIIRENQANSEVEIPHVQKIFSFSSDLSR